MKENLLNSQDKKTLREMATKLGVQKVEKLTLDKLRNILACYSYSKLVDSMPNVKAK